MSNLQDRLLKMAEKMPAFPTCVNRVIELSSDTNCDYKDLINVIEHDPVMTLKVLRLVNSAYFALPREIMSINHAVVYVGFNTVKNLAISIASIGMLPHENEAGLDMKQFLHHSLSTAALVRLLSKQVGATERETSDYFVAGLLHDIGKIVFAQFMPREFKQVLSIGKEDTGLIIEAEKEVIGADHTQVGALLGKKWKLPSLLLEGINSHHSADYKVNESNKLLVYSVFVANKLSKELEMNNNLDSFSEGLKNDITSRFGTNLNNCIASPEDLREEVRNSLQFFVNF